MNIDIKTYSYSKIKTFVNLRYLSMRIPDLIFKMLSYFAYNFLMVLIITFLANAAFNKFINFVVNNIDIVLSIGGLVSGFLDILVGDKKLNNKICTIKLW